MLIGLTGKAGSGKNTVADIICRMVPRCEQYAFAQPLKDMALAIDPAMHHDWYLTDLVDQYGWEGAKQYPEVRRFLQRLGTEGVRGTFGDDAWVNLMHKWYDGCGLNFDVGVITDVRFPNEARAVRRRGGVVVQIERPDAPDLGSNANHASEQGVQAQVTIVNDSDIGALELRVWEFLDSLDLTIK